VEPSPEQAVATAKPRSAGPLPMENGHLMSEGQHLKFQRGPTPKPEGDQKNHCRQDRKHAGHDKTVGAKLQCLQRIRNYEQPQEPRPAPFQKGDGLANFARTVKRTGFSAPGDKPEKFAESGAELTLSGSHRAQKCRATRGFAAISRLQGSTKD